MKKLMHTKRRDRSRRARALAQASGRAISGANGFTLIEMLVAVGAVAFVAVGIASIFASVGDTVSRGRSVSAITQYAAVLERQMRADFDAMTRDGYLIIRHEEADAGNDVPLYPDQPIGDWRPRRVDELMFFVDTPSASAREPLAPGYNAEGASARIYYGIGQRMEPGGVNSAYAQPDVTTPNRPPVTAEGHFLGASTTGNPNRFANSWTLLRHATTLVSIGGGRADTPASLPAPYPSVSPDNRLQVGLTPAAESIFRSVNALDYSACPLVFPLAPTIRNTAGITPPNRSPIFESGLVDVATTNLEEIRGIVQSSAGLRVTTASGAPAIYQYLSPFQLTDCADYVGPSYVVGPVGMQQAWMLDGLPAPSHPVQLDFSPTETLAPGVEPAYRSVNLGDDEIARMRYEPAPPDLHTPLADSVTNPTRGAIRLADQSALASSAFIPRVSEFIVEWSFGKLDEEGQMIWHGAEREIDVNGDSGPFDPTIDVKVLPYPQYYKDVRGTSANLAGSFFVPYRLQQPAQAGAAGVGAMAREFTAVPRLGSMIASSLNGDFADVGDAFASYPVLPEVVHGVRVSGLGGSGSPPTVSYFGYTLPFFDPDNPDGSTVTPGMVEPDAAAEETLEWPWPELVRVTVTLADPGDETVERTFQYVFPTPGNSAR